MAKWKILKNRCVDIEPHNISNYWYVVSPGAGGGRCDEEQHRQGPREGQQAQ